MVAATSAAAAVPSAVRCIAPTNASRAGSTTPSAARAEAGESIVATLGAVEQAQGGDPQVARSAAAVVGPARDAFVGAMHLTALGTVAAALVAASITLIWMPGRRRGAAAPR